MPIGDYGNGAVVVLDGISIGWVTNAGVRVYTLVANYHVQLASGNIGRSGSRSIIPGAPGQASLENLYQAVLNAAKGDEGI